MPVSELEKKQIGMNFSAAKNADILQRFQNIALSLTVTRGSITIDDVREMAEMDGIEYEPSNWMGSVFQHTAFIATGEFRKSTHKGSHGRLVRVWRRK